MQITPTPTLAWLVKKRAKRVLGWHAVKVVLGRGVLDESTSIDAVLFDLTVHISAGDKDELFTSRQSRLIYAQDGTDEEIREFGNRSDYTEMRKLYGR